MNLVQIGILLTTLGGVLLAAPEVITPESLQALGTRLRSRAQRIERALWNGGKAIVGVLVSLAIVVLAIAFLVVLPAVQNGQPLIPNHQQQNEFLSILKWVGIVVGAATGGLISLAILVAFVAAVLRAAILLPRVVLESPLRIARTGLIIFCSSCVLQFLAAALPAGHAGK